MEASLQCRPISLHRGSDNDNKSERWLQCRPIIFSIMLVILLWLLCFCSFSESGHMDDLGGLDSHDPIVAHNVAVRLYWQNQLQTVLCCS